MKKLVILSLIIFVMMTMMLPIHASEATTYTVTLDAKGQYIRTQDAYLPEMVNIDMGLSKPEDMMFDDQGTLWIADTGNKRILTYDTNTNTILAEIQ